MQGADVTFEGRGEAEEIDSWLIGPFHRFSLLAPWAQVAGFGSFGQYPRSAAALALRGAMPDSEEATVIRFPPDGSSVLTGTMYLSEWPDPLAPCPAINFRLACR